MQSIELPADLRSCYDIAIAAGGLGFKYRVGQIRGSVANGFLGVVLPKGHAAEMGPATRYTLRCNTASTIKI